MKNAKFNITVIIGCIIFFIAICCIGFFTSILEYGDSTIISSASTETSTISLP